jgi:predicted PurR-regulated permease PerM
VQLAVHEVKMSLSVGVQVRYWGIGLAVLVLVLWLLGNTLLPFVAGMAIAYFLDPVADRLQKLGCSRTVATALITITGLMIGILLLILVIPQLVEQLISLISSAPDYFRQLQAFLTEKFPSVMEEQSYLRRGISSLIESINSRAGQFANTLLASAFSLIDALIFMVITPVVAFYMLLDWDRMVKVIDSWLPRDHLETMRELARDVDKVLAGFVRGQLSVCGILGVFYAVALMSVGLTYGLVVGLLAGLISFIPYVGSIIGGLLSIGLAFFQFWDTPVWIAVVAGIFVIGQMVEGNFLTPKLVGGSVGLHPVWLMAALSVFGTFLGFTGMLVAVPVAASLGVFFRFGIRQYLGGRLYQGLSGEPAGDDEK